MHEEMNRILSYIINTCLITLVSLQMSSCMVGRKYSRPDLHTPDSTLLIDSIDLFLSDMKWWELYSDRNLQMLITEALEYNKDMMIAASRVKELASLRRLDNSALLPQIGLNLYGDREWENYGGNNTVKSSEFDTKLTVNWELDLLGNLRWAKEKGIAEYLSSVESQRSLQMFIIAEVANSYFELMALDNELDIVKQTLSTREEGVRQAKLRFEGGLTSETSYQQAQVELANTATLIPELMKKVSQKENEIAFICGRYPGNVERKKIDVLLQLPENLALNLSSELLKRRPDIRAAEFRLIAANAEVGMVYTDRFPRVNLTGMYGLESDQFLSILKSPYGFISGALISPLFSFGAKKAKYKAQQAVYEQEAASFEKTVLTAFHETDNAIMAYKGACETKERRQELEQASKKYVELARLQYINGVISYFDVLDAQRNYFDAQIGLSNAVRDEYISIVNLYKSLGGGWDF